MKKHPIFLIVLLLAAAGCKPHMNNKELLDDLKKRDAALRDSIQIVEDSIKARGGMEVKAAKVQLQSVAASSFKHYV